MTLEWNRIGFDFVAQGKEGKWGITLRGGSSTGFQYFLHFQPNFTRGMLIKGRFLNEDDAIDYAQRQEDGVVHDALKAQGD